MLLWEEGGELGLCVGMCMCDVWVCVLCVWRGIPRWYTKPSKPWTTDKIPLQNESLPLSTTLIKFLMSPARAEQSWDWDIFDQWSECCGSWNSRWVEPVSQTATRQGRQGVQLWHVCWGPWHNGHGRGHMMSTWSRDIQIAAVDNLQLRWSHDCHPFCSEGVRNHFVAVLRR